MDALFDPKWRNLALDAVPIGWEHHWLTVPGSLTRHLSAVCQHDLQVKVLAHHFVPAPLLACADLKLAAGDGLLYREVLLCDRDLPLVFACSLLPEAALCGRYQELRELGSRPLGHWIFSEPALQRHNVCYLALDTQQALFQNLRQQIAVPAALWGRKALFVGANKPLLVSEFFLPALAAYESGYAG